MQGNHSGEVSGGVQVVQNEGSVVAVDGDEGRGFKIIWGIEGLTQFTNPVKRKGG